MAIQKGPSGILGTSIEAGEITDGSITEAKLASAAVTAAKLASGSVTTAKIAASNITPALLAQPFTSGTAVASTSGTAIDFTGLPSWVKRIAVMFNGVSTNGTSLYLIQLGSGSVDTAGYVSTCIQTEGSALYTPQSSTSGFIISHSGTSDILSGQMVLTLVDGNVWVSSHQGKTDTTSLNLGGGNKSALSGALDRVRITTVNGTDTFDAGSINIMYE